MTRQGTLGRLRRSKRSGWGLGRDGRQGAGNSGRESRAESISAPRRHPILRRPFVGLLICTSRNLHAPMAGDVESAPRHRPRLIRKVPPDFPPGQKTPLLLLPRLPRPLLGHKPVLPPPPKGRTERPPAEPAPAHPTPPTLPHMDQLRVNPPAKGPHNWMPAFTCQPIPSPQADRYKSNPQPRESLTNVPRCPRGKKRFERPLKGIKGTSRTWQPNKEAG